MISGQGLIECVKTMTESERREFISLLIPSFANLPDFRNLAGLSAVHANQFLTSQEALIPRHIEHNSIIIEIDSSR
jgi:hypothetical protein